MEVFYSFTVAIGLPGDASDYNEDKRSAVADLQRAYQTRLSSESWEWDFGYLGRIEAAVRK